MSGHFFRIVLHLITFLFLSSYVTVHSHHFLPPVSRIMTCILVRVWFHFMPARWHVQCSHQTALCRCIVTRRVRSCLQVTMNRRPFTLITNSRLIVSYCPPWCPAVPTYRFHGVRDFPDRSVLFYHSHIGEFCTNCHHACRTVRVPCISQFWTLHMCCEQSAKHGSKSLVR